MSAECLPEGYVCPPPTRTSIGGSAFCIPGEDSGADDASLGDGTDGRSSGDGPTPGEASASDVGPPPDASAEGSSITDAPSTDETSPDSDLPEVRGG